MNEKEGIFSFPGESNVSRIIGVIGLLVVVYLSDFTLDDGEQLFIRSTNGGTTSTRVQAPLQNSTDTDDGE